MAVSAEARAFALELFDGLGDLSVRAMMGGLAIYCRGQVFALMRSDERLYVKAEGPLAAALAAEGAEQFTHRRKDGVTARMGYWTLPDAAVDDPDLACDWGRRALASAYGGGP